MADSMIESRKEAVGATFNITPSSASLSSQKSPSPERNLPPLPPPMVARPAAAFPDEGSSHTLTAPPMIPRPNVDSEATAAGPVRAPPMMTRPAVLEATDSVSALRIMPDTTVDSVGVPPMVARPLTQKSTDYARAPPPLKRMSTTNSNNDLDLQSDSDVDIDADVAPPSPTSLFPQSSKQSKLDSLVGKIIATKSSDLNRAESPSTTLTTPSMSDTSFSNTESSIATPPPLRRCAPSPDISKSRRKQAAPQATNDRVTESPPRHEPPQTVVVPDIDEMLKECTAVVTPLEAPNLEIDINSEDEDEFRPMRVSSKGRVVKKPSWADAYTDHTATETEEEQMEWTPEKRKPKSSADSFRPRPPPVLIAEAKGKGSITHEDLHPSMILDNPPSELLKPFKHGWLRELVIRNPQNENIEDMDRKHTTADTYYYSPHEYGSVKLRSVVKIQEFLHEKNVPNLSSNCFTFAKRAIYKAPEEFVRMAGKSNNRKSAGGSAGSLAGVLKEKSPKTKSPKIKSQPVQTVASVKKESLGAVNSLAFTPHAGMKIIRGAGTLPPGAQLIHVGNKLPIPGLKRPVNASPGGIRPPPSKKIRADKGAVERAKLFLTSSSALSTLQSVASISNKSKLTVVGPAGKPPALKAPQPCTGNCVGVANKCPSVQCGVCLLLYHPECINWSTNGRESLFVCSICIRKSRSKFHNANGSSNSSIAPRFQEEESSNVKPKNTLYGSQIEVKKAESPLLNEALNTKNSVAKKSNPNKQGRLITIPLHVLDKIDTTSPFALKLNNETFKIDPSRMIKTPTGVKIFIKNDQVLKPSEVLSSTKPLPQKKYRSIYDCYSKVSKSALSSSSAKTSDGRSAPSAGSSSESLSQSHSDSKIRTVSESGFRTVGDSSATVSTSESSLKSSSDAVKSLPSTDSSTSAGRTKTSAESIKSSSRTNSTGEAGGKTLSDAPSEISSVTPREIAGESAKSQPTAEGEGSKISSATEPENRVDCSSDNLDSDAKTVKSNVNLETLLNNRVSMDTNPVSMDTNPVSMDTNIEKNSGIKSEPMDTTIGESISGSVSKDHKEGETGPSSGTEGSHTTAAATGSSMKVEPSTSENEGSGSQQSKNAQALQDTSSSLPVKEPKSNELQVKDILANMVDCVAVFERETEIYDKALAEHTPKVVPLPVIVKSTIPHQPYTGSNLTIAATGPAMDEVTSKLNSMNKPTDPRPSAAKSSTSVASMSEFLYDKNNSAKTYAKNTPGLGDSTSAASVLRSLVPKANNHLTVIGPVGGTAMSGSMIRPVNTITQQPHAIFRNSSMPTVLRCTTPTFPVRKTVPTIVANVRSPPQRHITINSAGHITANQVQLQTQTITATQQGIPGMIVLPSRQAPINVTNMSIRNVVGVSGARSMILNSGPSALTTNHHNITTVSMAPRPPMNASGNLHRLVLVSKPAETPLGRPVYSSRFPTPAPVTVVSALPPVMLEPALKHSTPVKPLTVTVKTEPRSIQSKPATVKPQLMSNTPAPVIQYKRPSAPSSSTSTSVRAASHPLTFSITGQIYGCLLKIFSYLFVQDRLRAGQVCKQWRAVTQDRSLTTRLYFGPEFTLTDKVLAHPSLLSPHITELILPKLTSIPPVAFLNAISDLKELSRLSFNSLTRNGECWLTEQYLEKIFSLPRVESLSITGGLRTPSDLSSLSALEFCTPIRNLSMKGFSSVELTAILDLITKYRAQEVRNIELVVSPRASTLFSDDEDKFDGDKETFSCLKKCTHLENLSLNYSSKSRASYTVEFKMKVISKLEELEDNVSATARFFGIHRKQVLMWKKAKEEIMSGGENSEEHMRKMRLRTKKASRPGGEAKHPEMEQKLYEWIVEEKRKNRMVRLKEIRAKAKQLQPLDFSASKGWMYRFFSRYSSSKGSRTPAVGQSIIPSSAAANDFFSELEETVTKQNAEESVSEMAIQDEDQPIASIRLALDDSYDDESDGEDASIFMESDSEEADDALFIDEDIVGAAITTASAMPPICTTSAASTNSTASATPEIITTSATSTISTTSATSTISTTSITPGSSTTSATPTISTTPAASTNSATSGTPEIISTSATSTISTTSVSPTISTTFAASTNSATSITPGSSTTSATPTMSTTSAASTNSTMSATPGSSTTSSTAGSSTTSVTPGSSTTSVTPGSSTTSVTPIISSASATPGIGITSATLTIGATSVTPGSSTTSVTPIISSASATPGIGITSATLTIGATSVTPGISTTSATLTIGATSATPTNSTTFATPTNSTTSATPTNSTTSATPEISTTSATSTISTTSATSTINTMSATYTGTSGAL